jgi:uncharacterized membrane protein
LVFFLSISLGFLPLPLLLRGLRHGSYEKVVGYFSKDPVYNWFVLICRQIFISYWFLRERKKSGIRSSQLGATVGRVVRSRASSSQAAPRISVLASKQSGSARAHTNIVVVVVVVFVVVFFFFFQSFFCVLWDSSRRRRRSVKEI